MADEANIHDGFDAELGCPCLSDRVCEGSAEDHAATSQCVFYYIDATAKTEVLHDLAKYEGMSLSIISQKEMAATPMAALTQ